MRASVLGPVVGVCSLATACGQSTARNEQAPSPAVEASPVSCETAVGVGQVLTIDDFEDGDLELDQSKNLRGVWYVNNDGTGEQAPAPGNETGSGFIADSGSPDSPEHALHTSGVGFERWGAFAAARFNSSRGRACVYDLSAYSGVSLQARGQGSVRLNLGTVATTPVEDGGACNAETCSDYGISISIDADWRSVDVPLQALSQPTWAKTAAFAPAQALRLALWAEGGDFEFWIDDVRFYR